MPRDLANFSRRSAIATGMAGLAASVFLLLWYGVDVLLLIFAGLLLAILLRGLGDWLARTTGLSPGWALSLLLLSAVAATAVGGWVLGTRVADQFAELAERLPSAAADVRARIEERRWGRELLRGLPDLDRLGLGRGDAVSRVTGIASGALGRVGSAIVVLFVGVFVAYEPGVYRRGLLHLVPPRRRGRAEEVLSAVGGTLRGWLAGKVFSMAVVGVLTATGLWALGVPLAVPLGIITALFSFIPNIGPVLSVIPAALIALPGGPETALQVVALFVAIQTVESYLLTPLVQRNLIALPPALIISAQVLLGVLLGGLGVIVATPLTAAAVVLVNKLYVEDVLGGPEGERTG